MASNAVCWHGLVTILFPLLVRFPASFGLCCRLSLIAILLLSSSLQFRLFSGLDLGFFLILLFTYKSVLVYLQFVGHYHDGGIIYLRGKRPMLAQGVCRFYFANPPIFNVNIFSFTQQTYSPDQNQRLVMINCIYRVKYSVRNSLDKLNVFSNLYSLQGRMKHLKLGGNFKGTFFIKLKGQLLKIKRALLCLLQNLGGTCPPGSYVFDSLPDVGRQASL